MKNLNDMFSGAVLLCLCAVGAYEVSASIAPSDGEVVGADALPTLALGDWLVEQSWFPWPHNGGFTISTFLFLLFSLPLLGRRNPVEIMGVAALTTGALLYAFGYFFQIMLP